MDENKQPNPKADNPETSQESGQEGDKPEWYDKLKDIPVKDIMSYAVTERGDEKFDWGSKQVHTMTPKDTLRRAHGDIDLEQRNETFQKEKAEFDKLVDEQGRAKAIKMLETIGYEEERIRQLEAAAANPDGQSSDKKEEPVNKDTKGEPGAADIAELRKKLKTEIMGDLQSDLEKYGKQIGNIQNTLDQANFSRLQAAYPTVLNTHLEGGKIVPDNPMAYRNFLFLWKEAKMAPDDAAEQVKKELEARDTAMVKAEIDKQVEAGKLAPPVPGREAPTIPENWDGTGGLKKLYGTEEPKSRSTGIPDDDYFR